MLDAVHEVQNRYDMRVVELGLDHGLALEALHDPFILAELLMQDLDRHVTAKAGIVTAVHGRHATLAKKATDLVVADAGGERQAWLLVGGRRASL